MKGFMCQFSNSYLIVYPNIRKVHTLVHAYYNTIQYYHLKKILQRYGTVRYLTVYLPYRNGNDVEYACTTRTMYGTDVRKYFKLDQGSYL